jgi:circadian clock protein KaiC
VLPITSLALNHKVSTERIATGIPRLDAMLGGRGFFRGSSILLTGTTADSSVGAPWHRATPSQVPIGSRQSRLLARGKNP